MVDNDYYIAYIEFLLEKNKIPFKEKTYNKSRSRVRFAKGVVSFIVNENVRSINRAEMFLLVAKFSQCGIISNKTGLQDAYYRIHHCIRYFNEHHPDLFPKIPLENY